MLTQNIVETVKATFDFSVEKFPLTGPDNMRTEWYGLFRSDDMSPVGSGSVTSRYVPHTTDDVLALVEAAGEVFGGVNKVTCDFNHGHRLSIMPTNERRVSIFGEADNIFPRLVIDAGYDGSAFKATLGYYRDLCRNLHRLQSVQSTTTAIRHTHGLRDKMNVLVKQFGELNSSWESLAKQAVRLESEQINMATFMDELYGKPSEAGRGLTMHQSRSEAIFRRLLDERNRSGRGRVENLMVSKWEALNAIQGYMQHDASRRGTNRTATPFARAMLSMDSAIVARAEELLLTTAV